MHGDLDGDDANAQYTIEISGTAGPGEQAGHDQVAVIGDVSLGGTLDVTLLNGFVPEDDDNFVILEYTGSLTGTFATVNLPAAISTWLIYYQPGEVYLAKHAQCFSQVNWDGGGPGDNWNTPSNWSNDEVPRSCNDDYIGPGVTVIVPAGFDALAQSVRVQGSALSIDQGATLVINMRGNDIKGFQNIGGLVTNIGMLEISNSDGFLAHGIANNSSAVFENYGVINITGIQGTPAYGIANFADFENFNTLVISNTQSFPIVNGVNVGAFLNEGSITISDSPVNGIINSPGATFNNDGGTITLLAPLGTYAIANQGNFINGTGGMINALGASSRGLLVTGGTAVFTNRGDAQF